MITVDDQGNYPNIKRNLAKKANFAISKFSERRSHQLSGKSCLKEARFQKLTTRALSKEIRTWKQKHFKSIAFSIIFLEKLDWKISCATRRQHWDWWDAEVQWGTHTWGRFPGDESRNNSSQRIKFFEENWFTSKEYLGLTTNLRPSVYRKTLDCSLSNPVGLTKPSFFLFVHLHKKSLEDSTNLKEIFFGNFPQ